MRNKALTRVLCAALSSLLVVTGSYLPVKAQTLSEAGLTEETRGYGGNGTQNKSRGDESITVKVSVGGGGTGSDWVSLESFQPYIASDDVVMLNREVTFGDMDSDGDIDSTDLFRKLEDYKRGDVSLGLTTSEMGDFYTSVFGIDAGGSFTYWINSTYCMAGTPDLYDGDTITLVAFTGEYNSWGSTDDSAYDGYKSDVIYTTLDEVLNATSNASQPSDPSDPTDPVEPETPQEPEQTQAELHTKYINQVNGSLATGYQTSGTGLWQQLRILRFAKGSDKSAFATYQSYFASNHGITLGAKAVDDMRVLSVVDNETAMNNLLYGPGFTIDDVEDSSEALVYDKKAGMYAMDYILMVLDLTGAGLEDDDLTNRLSDYTTTVSVRDDLVYTILNTSGCWGGSWFTYDTGCQNAQSLAPYYNRYAEVKTKLDEFEATAYNHFMDESYTGSNFDASCAGEYVRFAALLSKETNNATFAQHALDVFNKIETIGLENTKYHGNTMDVWRMAIAEWGLNELDATTGAVAVGELRLYTDQVASGLNNITYTHMQANEDIANALLYEVELKIPSGITVQDVTSTVAEATYGVEGDILRIVVANLNGEPLRILKDSDIFKIKVKAPTSGTYQFEVLSSIFRTSEEDFRESEVQVVPAEVIGESTISATVLYKGADKSRFISKDLQAVKVVLSTDKAITGTLQYQVGDKYYNLYSTEDFKAGEGLKVFVGLIPVSVTTADLQNADKYFVADTTTKTLEFGNTDGKTGINSADALWVIKLWVGKLKNPSDYEVLSSNVTKDTDINNADTLAIVARIIDKNYQFKVLK